jgi:hypothetical protein
MQQFFYYLLAWLVLGFNAGVINILIMYLKNEITHRRRRNSLFKRNLYLGGISFVIQLVYLVIILFTRRK